MIRAKNFFATFSQSLAARMAFVLCMVVLGVTSGTVRSSETKGSSKLNVVATTGMIADIARQVGGERVVVKALMGPGVDPHLYKPTASDTTALMRADIVLYNGLRLEGRMESLFEKLKRSGRAVHAVTDGIPKERLLARGDIDNYYDPHVWFDVSLWALTVPEIARVFAEADPEGAEFYQKNARDVTERLSELHAWCIERAKQLPAERRILVTSHDAFEYFGKAYGFKVVGLQGVSTVSEAALSDMTGLVDFIRKQGVPAIFVESSVNPQAIRRVAEDSGARIGGEIFSDAMGGAGEMRNGFDTGTYEGMVRYNMSTIVDALRPADGAEKGDSSRKEN